MVTRSQLKQYFETGDVPTQSQFWALIDEMRLLSEPINGADVQPATIPPNTLVGNPTGSSAVPVNVPMADLPVSTATQTALDGKQDASANLDRLDGTAAQQRAALSINTKNIILFGADPTGATDSTAAILSADAAAQASGGDVIFPSGVYRVDGLLRLADAASGAAIRTMRPRRWIGDGSWKDTTASSELPAQGTVLDCRNNTAPAILLKPRGSFEMRGIGVTNLGTPHTQPLLKITNTTSHIIDCSFIGHSTKTGVNCDQDAIVFGGTTSDAIGNGDDSPFQGYGTTIERCYFERIRHVATWQMFANDIKFINNVVWYDCGGDTVFVCNPVIADQYVAGALIADNTIEMHHYTTWAKLTRAAAWWFRGNGLYDENILDPLGIIHLTDSPAIRIDNGLMPVFTRLVKDNGGSSWTFFSTVQGQETYFGPLFPFRADSLKTRGFLADSGNSPVLCQAHTDHTEGLNDVIGPRCVSKDGSITYFQQLRNGQIDMDGTVQSIINAKDWSLRNDGYRRKGAGGSIFFDSGTGGSVNTYKGFRHVFQDHTGTEMIRLQSGVIQITGLPTSNPGGSGLVWNGGGVLKIT